MGKEGPCCHCGVTSTPLWRNGPAEKPILCNACGSRWRIKGTLANYTPLHSRSRANEYEDLNVSKANTISLKQRDGTMKKRKLNYEKNSIVNTYSSKGFYNKDFVEMTYEDTSNRSSSGSAVSNSERCAQFSSADASDLSGPTQSVAWESQIPSKKRTCIPRMKSSPVEKLIKDLHAILHEQESSCLSGFPEEDLLFESNEPMVSVEIGHGSVLIKHPSSIVREEDSEASSLSVEIKPFVGNDLHTCSTSLCHGSESVSDLSGKMTQQETANSHLLNHDKMQLFWTHDSPLCYVDLNDVINFEVLVGHLTIDEQQLLLKYLPPSDKFQLPRSLREMFDTGCFKENLLCFQQLLSEGVFSNTGSKSDELKTLKKLALSNLTKSKWLELYSKLKDHHAGEFPVESGSELTLLEDLGSAKRPFYGQQKNMSDKQTTIRGSKPLDNNDSFFKPKSLFGMPTDSHCMALESCVFPDESSDQDLLLDIPSNSSFPEAEFIVPSSSFI